MAPARNSSTSGQSTASQPTDAGRMTPDNTSSGVSVMSGLATKGPDTQVASGLCLAIERFRDDNTDAPFVPTACVGRINDPLAAVHARYEGRDMAAHLEAILRPFAATHGAEDNDASSGASDTDDEAYPPVMTPTTEASDTDSLLSLSDNEEPIGAGPTA